MENLAKKKLDNLMKESKIRDREDPDSFTIAALPPAGKPTDKSGSKVNADMGPAFFSLCLHHVDSSYITQTAHSVQITC